MKCVKPTGTVSILDRDIGSFYPSSIQVVMPAKITYRFLKTDNVWRISTSSKSVHQWMSEFLPESVEYQGDIYLSEPEYMMLVLKFGPGEDTMDIVE